MFVPVTVYEVPVEYSTTRIFSVTRVFVVVVLLTVPLLKEGTV
jgi:hypothetical protein